MGLAELAAHRPRGEELVITAQRSFSDATTTSFAVAAGVLVIAAVLVGLRAPGSRHEGPARPKLRLR